MRTRIYAAGLIASILLPFCGQLVPENPLLSEGGLFSLDARAAEAIRTRANGCRWNNLDWQDMSAEQRNAWRTLGWTDQMWDSQRPVQAASDSKAWADLSENERAAARWLGYTPNSWDADNCH